MRYVLKHETKDSWFRDWCPIGPRFTDDAALALVFDSEKEAMLASSRHFAFVGYAPIKAP